jgi:hypothetical protein
VGILAEPLRAIVGLGLKPGFRVAELGDQWVTCVTPHRLARDWYQQLGCGDYVSIDGNGRGTHLWDLNCPLPMGILSYVGRFDLVTDFGTGEHIFDQAQVWRTIHDLCTVGGYLAWDRPVKGYATHGYYCLDRCLFDDLEAANGYRVVERSRRKTSRGILERGIWQRVTAEPFKVPQQGRYQSSLKI